MNHRGETAELAAIAQPTVALVNNAQREHQEFMRTVGEVAAEHADLIRALPPGRRRGRQRRRRVRRRLARRGAAASRASGRRIRARPSGGGARAIRGARDGSSLDAVDAGGRCDGRACRAGTAQRGERARGGDGRAGARRSARGGRARPRSVSRGAGPARGDARGERRRDHRRHVQRESRFGARGDRRARRARRRRDGWCWATWAKSAREGPAFHREAGALAREAGIDRLLTTGALAAEAGAAFGAGADHFATVDALAAHVAATAGPGATVLVKGSRFMRMERVRRRRSTGRQLRREGAH